MAGVLAIRAARGEAGHTPGQDLRLTDPEGAATALTTLGWQFAGDLLSGDDENSHGRYGAEPGRGTAAQRDGAVAGFGLDDPHARRDTAHGLLPRGAADGTVPGLPQLEQ